MELQQKTAKECLNIQVHFMNVISDWLSPRFYTIDRDQSNQNKFECTLLSENVEVFTKLENSLSQLTNEQAKADLRFKNISTEIKEKEHAFVILEESRNVLKNELDRVENELAEKRLNVSKYSTNDQLYQFRVIFILTRDT